MKTLGASYKPSYYLNWRLLKGNQRDSNLDTFHAYLKPSKLVISNSVARENRRGTEIEEFEKGGGFLEVKEEVWES